MALIIDLETAAIEWAGALVEPVSAPANYKKAEAIAAYVAEAQAAQITKAGLYPWTARIVAMGWCDEGDEVVTVKTCNGDAVEAAVLAEFWSHAVDSVSGAVSSLVTFNGLGFDLPVLMVRSRLLGVTSPILNIDKYRSPHPDLMQILTFRGAIQSRSLNWFARRFGLNTDDAFSGKEIAQLVEDGNWDAIRAHCASDVTLTRQLAERMGVIKPVRRHVAA